MKVINEPRYQDFNGEIHRTEEECIHAEDVFAHKVFKILDEVTKGCKNHGNTCSQCPFYDYTDEQCYFEFKIDSLPKCWHLEGGE